MFSARYELGLEIRYNFVLKGLIVHLLLGLLTGPLWLGLLWKTVWNFDVESADTFSATHVYIKFHMFNSSHSLIIAK